MSNLTNYYNYHPDYPTAFTSTSITGVEVRRQLGQKGFYLQSGIRLNGFGWKYRHPVNESNNIYKSKVTFFAIPLIATYKFKKIGSK